MPTPPRRGSASDIHDRPLVTVPTAREREGADAVNDADPLDCFFFPRGGVLMSSVSYPGELIEARRKQHHELLTESLAPRGTRLVAEQFICARNRLFRTLFAGNALALLVARRFRGRETPRRDGAADVSFHRRGDKY